MIAYLLRAKHWQVFTAIVGIPMILYFAFVAYIFSEMMRIQSSGAIPDPMEFIGWFRYFPVFMFLILAPLFAWQWSVAIGLNKLIPVEHKLKAGLFTFSMIYPFIYFASMIFLAYYFFTFQLQGIIESNIPPEFTGIWIIIPFHILAVFCMFYNIYFVAKSIKTAEVQRSVTIGDFILEAVFVWFLPIGIWFLQPRINKMIAEDNSEQIEHLIV